MRIGRAWGLTDAVRPGDLVAGELVLCGDGASRALAGAAERAARRASCTRRWPPTTAARWPPATCSSPIAAWDVLAHDLESAAVLAAAARAGVRAATLVAIQAPGEDDAVAERLGPPALAAIPATS